jgi:adenosine deaminase
VGLILSFLRHLPEADCLAMLEAADPFRERFVAIGLASSEKDFPPKGFQRLYAAAKERGYRLTAHAGEEGPASFVRDALDLLGVERIDHGVRAIDDEALLEDLAAQRIPLTVCPLSNLRLRVIGAMDEHCVFDLLERGLCVTVNSDDPAYFGGDLLENFAALERDLGMTRAQAQRLVRNGFEAAFLDQDAKAVLDGELDAYLADTR